MLQQTAWRDRDGVSQLHSSSQSFSLAFCLSAYPLLMSPSLPLISLLCLLSLSLSLFQFNPTPTVCLRWKRGEEGCIEKDVSLSNKAAYKSSKDFVSIVSG